MKTIDTTCCDCGAAFTRLAGTPTRIRCADCQKKHTRKMHNEYRRNKRSSAYVPKSKDFNLTMDMHMRLEDVADHFGVTKERIRQIEYRALAKIKTQFPGLSEFL